MRPVTLLVVLLAIGCAKKAEPYKRQFDDSGAKFEQTDDKSKSDAPKKDAEEKPSWIKPRVDERDLPAGSGGKPAPWVQSPPPAGNGQLPPVGIGNPVGQPGPVVVAPPVAQAPATRPATGTQTAPGKLVTRADINEVWVFVENFSQANQGKMPRPELIYAALAETKAAAADLVKSGDIILTGAGSREGVWAFERKAPTQGGWIAGQNGPEELTAAEFARRVRQ